MPRKDLTISTNVVSYIDLLILKKYSGKFIMLKIDRFYDARRELRKVLRHTPLIPAPRFSTEAEVYIKPENLQVTGPIYFSSLNNTNRYSPHILCQQKYCKG